MSELRFCLIGVAGYIAPRHMKAIHDVGAKLVAAYDLNDSVGIMDSFSPEANFFTNMEGFLDYIDELSFSGNKPDYVSICSPNYLHVSHIKSALKNGINVICEKPLALYEHEIDELKFYEEKYSAKVNTILQLRLHPSIISMKEKVESAPKGKIFDVELTYMTSRGRWYLKSWKGDVNKSGGLATNIGVHFFDMLHYIFGSVKRNDVHYRDDMTTSGYIEFERARVKWFLSIDENQLPDNAVIGEKKTFRNILIEGEELEFSGGFTELHTESYKRIISNRGYGLEDNRQALALVEKLRSSELCNDSAKYHPLLSRMIDSEVI